MPDDYSPSLKPPDIATPAAPIVESADNKRTQRVPLHGCFHLESYVVVEKPTSSALDQTQPLTSPFCTTSLVLASASLPPVALGPTKMRTLILAFVQSRAPLHVALAKQ